ncbi:hypothetical protein KVR01_011633 [Diaporthe batatas]|uniref:uncharacterized protein n=1 Tax=Diaporthe batatas TaxID=748121 RepID=UPI001D039B8E|nr:uncharacterized protein KVR01_011633 [Diaporthe batatas]KAG8158511.1 hypothetical protein KVR01_011633 [Diaporthe batatas]
MALATNTIPAGWKPASSGCQDRGDNWVWADSVWGMAVLGSPDQTSSCYPPDFTPTLGHLYTASSCPNGFTPACTTNYYSSSWSTLCCPRATGDSPYSCEYRSFWSWTAACVTAMYPYSTELTATATYFRNPAQPTGAAPAPTGDSPPASGTWTTSNFTSTYTTTLLSTRELFLWTTTYDEGQRLWALGVAISPPDSTSGVSTINGGQSSSSTTTGPSTSTSTSSPSGGGLSAGAAAGIAIAALLAAILIALGTWLLYRRGIIRKQRPDASGGGGGGTGPAGAGAGGHAQRPPASPAEQKLGPNELAGEQQARWWWRRPDEYVPQRSPVEVHDTDSSRYGVGGPHELP